MRFLRCLLLVCLLSPWWANTASAEDKPDDTLPHFPSLKRESSGIRWAPLLKQSLLLVGIQHSLRIAAESDTRAGLGGPFFHGWSNSVSNLHGWADGDPFPVNYIGHPVEGSIAGFLFVQNDPRYLHVEFGRNRDYWRSRLRATAFAFAYSTQFEIGPLSEATIGNVQGRFPQQGLVDHVITPVMGMVWMLGEDAIDKYLIRRFEEHTSHRRIALLMRSLLNPSRSAANALGGNYPWHRETRGGSPDPYSYIKSDNGLVAVTNSPRGNRPYAPFELGMGFGYSQFGGGGRGSIPCNGASANPVFHLTGHFGVEAEAGGCNAILPGQHVTGDATWFMAGPRYTFRDLGHWTPYVHALGGVEKLTSETFYPDRKAALPPPHSMEEANSQHSLYTSQSELTAKAIQLGGGVNYTINGALAVRVADLEYMRMYAPDFNGIGTQKGFRFTTGLVLRMGTW